MKTLSIIIPIYNVEEYLVECLDSVVGIDDIEIILVNDCTPDDSMKVAQTYIDKYSNIKLITHSVNKGLGAARNTGIENATGKYIFFLDSDDYLDKSKLKPLVDVIKDIDHDQVLISFIRFHEGGQNLPLEYEKVYSTYNEKVLDRSNFKILANIINLSQIRILKREKILSDNFRFPCGLYEDVLWSYWFAHSCESTLVLDNRIYFYRQRPDSILGSTSKKHMEIIKQYQRTIDLFKSKNVPLETMSVLEHRFIIATKWVLFKTQRIPLELQRDFSLKIIENMEFFLLNKSNKIKQLDIDLLNKSKKVKQLNTDLLNKSNKIEKLDTAFTSLTSIRFRYNPIKKIQAYKQLVKTYYSLRGK